MTLMTVSFSEHLDLLDMHGRAAVASLGQLSPDGTVPPRGESVRHAAADHWGTLEIWAWLLENPTGHWSRRAAPKAPADHPTLVAGIAVELGRLETSLLRTGPNTGVDYFGRPGTTAEVARMLAHEAIAVAHAASLAADRSTPTLHPATASDGIDQSLGHWASSDLDAEWRPEALAVRTTDTDSVWHLSLGEATDRPGGAFRLIVPTSPAAVVEGSSENVLWWLHGHASPEGAVTLSGDPETTRCLRTVLLHPVEEKPRRRRRWLG